MLLTFQAKHILRPMKREIDDLAMPDDLSIGDAIRQCPFFDVFSKDLQAAIANYLELFAVNAGDQVLAKGDSGSVMGIVMAGQMEVFIEGDRGRTFIAQLGPGEVFGEMAVIDDLPRSASCVAKTGGRVLVLFREPMRKMIQEEPELSMLVMFQIARTLSARLRSANALIASLQGSLC
jgi:CRP-like cAMP-binding protein